MQRYRLLILSLFVLLIGCSTPSTLVELKNTIITPSKFFDNEENSTGGLSLVKTLILMDNKIITNKQETLKMLKYQLDVTEIVKKMLMITKPKSLI